jgi:hypothetical protein
MEVPELSFTVVQKLPSDYPPLIVEQKEAQRIQAGFRIDRSVVVNQKDAGKPDSLLLDVSFPGPEITMASELVVSDAARKWHEAIAIVARHRAIGGSHRSGAADAPRVRFSSGAVSKEDGRLRVSIALPLDEASGRQLGAGDSILVTMSASEEIARSSPDISEYLDFRLRAVSRIADGDSTRPVEGE